MNIAIMTKDEWQAFPLILEVLRQMGPQDRLIAWDDFSSAKYVDDLQNMISVQQDKLNGHFGEHRNRVKEVYPKGEWILMLDADEFIQPGFIAALNCEAAKTTGVDAMFLERKNTFWDETGSVIPPAVDYTKPFKPDFQGRVFRNVPEIRYQGHVHEGLTGHQWPVYLTGAPFTLIHHKRNIPPRYAALCNPH